MRHSFERHSMRAAGWLVGLGLLFAALPTAGDAHVSDGKTSLAVRSAPALSFQAGATVVISGTLRSGVAACRAGRLVRLFGADAPGGKTRRIGTDRTNTRGAFRFVLSPKTAKRLYVAYPGSFRTSYGHSHRCRPSASRRLILTVRA